jgi:uncharacterized protein YbaA (DUF1428 family)
MNYVDGFVIPVPSKNLVAYKKIAKACAKIWMEHGALSYAECVGDGLEPGKLTSFPRSVKLKTDEVVVFSWIVYESKADQKRVMKLVMADPRMQNFMKTMPFDGKRMIWGSFKPFIELASKP